MQVRGDALLFEFNTGSLGEPRITKKAEDAGPTAAQDRCTCSEDEKFFFELQ